MVNGGWFGTTEEWNRLEEPLKSIDSVLESFASRNLLQLSKNHKDWPERSLVWGTDGRCLIEIYLAEKVDLTFNFWICASEDRGKKRYWKREFLKEKVRFEEISADLNTLLGTAKEKLDRWSAHPEMMEFATALHPLDSA